MNRTQYFDYAASCPPFEEAIQAYSENQKHFYANPSAQHKLGIKARENYQSLKNRMSSLCGFNSGKLVIVSSGSEANNAVVESFIVNFPKKKILLAEDVHASLWYAVKKYETKTEILSYEDLLNLDDDNNIDKKLTKDIGLLCISHVGNELGTLHDIKKLGWLCKKKGIQFHVDGVQALGHVDLNLDQCEFNSYSFSAHKFGGVRGCAGLFLNQSEIIPNIQGGPQEWGLRAGTENVAALAAACIALEKSIEQLNEGDKKLIFLEELIDRELGINSNSIIKNHPKIKVPGILSYSFKGCLGSEIVTAMSLEGFCLATGSSCSENLKVPSRHILALGTNEDDALGTIRISLGRYSEEDSVFELCEKLKEYVLNNG